MPALPLQRVAAGLALAFGLTGCSLIPTYERPPLAVPAQLPAEAASAVAGAASDAAAAIPAVPWTQYFPDPHLQGLIRLALEQNRDLRVAVLNIDQLRAAYQVTNADRFPTLNGGLTGARQPSTSPPYSQYTSFQLGVTVSSWELDLFGRVKALSEAASAQLFASEAARRATHISLVASVANAYYALWADRWQLALAEETLTTRTESLKLFQLKFDNGVLNELDLRSAQSLVESARVTRAQAQRQWAQDLNALQLLLGSAVPRDMLPPQPVLAVDAPAAAGSAPGAAAAASASDQVMHALQASLWPDLVSLPVGLSSDVLLQRPDIEEAEQLLISANANIGAARAARFPRITLTGSAGVVSGDLSGLFESGGRNAWSVSSSVTVPIFDAGRTKAGVDVAQAKRDIALAQYDKAVQTAFREVADALVARSTYAEQAQAQLAQAEAEAARLRLSTLRYDTGVASQLDLLDAQRALFTAQQSLIAAQLARQQAHISVYKALGGGWLAEPPATQMAAQSRPDGAAH
jgi:outer membrane protein TolC